MIEFQHTCLAQSICTQVRHHSTLQLYRAAMLLVNFSLKLMCTTSTAMLSACFFHLLNCKLYKCHGTAAAHNSSHSRTTASAPIWPASCSTWLTLLSLHVALQLHVGGLRQPTLFCACNPVSTGAGRSGASLHAHVTCMHAGGFRGNQPSRTAGPAAHCCKCLKLPSLTFNQAAVVVVRLILL